MKLTVNNISQRYGSNEVLKDVSFSACSGEVVALLGPNGSGKSTLIKTLCDLMPPKAGKVDIDGRDVACLQPIERAKLIGYVPQNVQHAPFTTVLDTVLVGRRPYVQWSYSMDDLDMASRAMETMDILDLRAGTSMSFPEDKGSGCSSPGHLPRALSSICSMSDQFTGPQASAPDHEDHA